MQLLCRAQLWFIKGLVLCTFLLCARAWGETKVVTSFTSSYVLSMRILKGVSGVIVTKLIVPSGRCLHSFEPSPTDIAHVFEANLFVENGAGLEPFAERLLAVNSTIKKLDASRGVELLNDDEGPNPHFWLSIDAVASSIENLGKQFSELLPDSSAIISKNVSEYVSSLKLLKVNKDVALTLVRGKKVILLHPALQYLAMDLNLNILDVVSMEEGVATPMQLRKIFTLAHENPDAVLLVDDQLSARIRKSLELDYPERVLALRGFLKELGGEFSDDPIADALLYDYKKIVEKFKKE